jgi:flagellar basal body-associated protein FliL
MISRIILQIVLVAVLLFFITNYFICSSHEKDALNKIILLKRNEDEEDKNFFNKLNAVRNNFYRAKFRMYLTRAVIFGCALGIAIYVLESRENELMSQMEPIIQSKNMFEMNNNTNNVPIEIKKPVQEVIPERQKVRHMFFNLPPF